MDYLPHMSTAKTLSKTDRRIYITADSHFGHVDALEWYGRKYANVEAMDAAMMDAINARVDSQDILLHLGDFMVKGGGRAWEGADLRRAQAYRDRIQCKRVYLIQGNHDPRGEEKFDAMFESVDEIVSVRGIKGIDERVVLFHYPLEQWQGRPTGAFHLHGHVHGFGTAVARRHDCGVDLRENGCTPLCFEELVTRLRTTPPSGFVRES